MAKHVLYGDITSTAKQPYLKQTHQHYNEMIDELTKAFGQTIVANSSVVTILWGCVNTGTGTLVGQSAIISAGAVYYNGEIYQVPAFSSASLVNGLKGTITTTYSGIDPVLFSDSTTHNVHQIKTLVLSDAVPATSPLDYNNWQIITRAWRTFNLTDSDVGVPTGTVTLAYAKKKQINYNIFGQNTIDLNIDYKNQMIFLNILIEGADVSASTLSSFHVKLPEGISVTENYKNMGFYVNSNNVTSEPSGTTKQCTTQIYTGSYFNLGYQYLTIVPDRSSFVNFSTDGTNNLYFQGQISIPFQYGV